MAITDLTGTTWLINSSITEPSSTILAEINFTSNSETFAQIRIYDGREPGNEQLIGYSDINSYPTFVYEYGWTNEEYRTIAITGGTDATNSTLIAWLESNAENVTPAAPDLVVTYAGNEIATLSDSGTKTLKTQGKYCTDDITINYTKSGGGGDGYTIDDIAERNMMSGSIYGNSASFISDYAFYGCLGLTTANFPVATFIGNYAFGHCSNLTTASFPAATSIGGYAFQNCYSLTTANFPAVTSIGNSAFTNCSRLTTASFSIATLIGSNAFYSCSRLTTVSFPAVTSIGNSAFTYCSRLTTVSFPAVTSIGAYAFYNCYSLTTASFPAATSIGISAFRGCRYLISLYLDNVSKVPTLSASAFYSTPIGGYSASAGQYGSVYVPASLYNSFLTATYWSSISTRIVSV